MKRRPLLAILLFPLVAMPAGALAVVALALGCIVQALASTAGFLLNLYSRLTERRDPPLVEIDLSPRAAAAVFRDGKFEILEDDTLAAEVAKLRERRGILQ